ncbi:hypothetical protein [Scandinavium sp.]|uniref:hypothetical protein n=1 Tax=Scandinavium sp. TaxID=2830653 RepID=UPI00289767FA|nr:hypothetical protein [Scandinavium sp.]
MAKNRILFTAPLMLCLLTACDDGGKAQFEAARTAALSADDPFQALATFEQNAGDYGTNCHTGFFSTISQACDERSGTGAEIVMAAGRLISLAEKAPADKTSQALFMSAAGVLQSGKYALQDSQKAISLYVKAWLSGNQKAADELVDVYRFLKDYRHAYFWEIRSRNLSRDTRSQLTNEEINDIQRAASDTQRPNL